MLGVLMGSREGMTVKVTSCSLNLESTEHTLDVTINLHLVVPAIPVTGMGSWVCGNPKEEARRSDIVGRDATASSRALASTDFPSW